MTAVQNIPLPVGDPIASIKPRRKGIGGNSFEDRITAVVEKLYFEATKPWTDWFNNQDEVVAKAPARVNSVRLTDKTTSIGATDFSGGSLASGLYRITWYTRVTQAATTSSSLQLAVDFKDGTITHSFSGAALTGNTTDTWESVSKLVHIDVGSPVRYTVTYASVGATPMKYEADFVLERVAL